MRLTFKQGIKDGIPICLGYFSVSMAFGLSVVRDGMPVLMAVLISLSNLTSAGQFAGSQLLLAHASLFEIASTTFIINLRYFLMSISLSQKVDSSYTFLQRMITSFGITDEIYALSTTHRQLSFNYMTGLMLMPILGWTGGTCVGAFASSLLPEILTSSMSIAMYGMFIAIIVPPSRYNKSVLFVIIFSILLSLAFTYIPLFSKISRGFTIILIALTTSSLAAVLYPTEREEH